MKITVYGASGMIGSRILDELVSGQQGNCSRPLSIEN
jgi:putative NADH-flavin reductase